jgi:acylphosphatase
MNKRLHAVVRGRVQMVGFRQFIIERAQRLGLTGWVRNDDAGNGVELVAEGPEERLRELEAALRQGPRSARVERVDAAWSEQLEGFGAFEVRW